MARNLKPAAPVLKPLDTRFADAVAVCEPHFPVWDRAVDAYVRSYEPPDGDIERQLSRDEVIGAGNVLCELLIVLCGWMPGCGQRSSEWISIWGLTSSKASI